MENVTEKDLKEVKKAIFLIYNSIKIGSLHPELKDIMYKFEKEVFRENETKTIKGR